MRFFYLKGGVVQGPHTLDELKNFRAHGHLADDTPACVEGGQSWEPLSGLLSSQAAQGGRLTSAVAMQPVAVTPTNPNKVPPVVVVAVPQPGTINPAQETGAQYLLRIQESSQYSALRKVLDTLILLAFVSGVLLLFLGLKIALEDKDLRSGLIVGASGPVAALSLYISSRIGLVIADIADVLIDARRKN